MDGGVELGCREVKGVASLSASLRISEHVFCSYCLPVILLMVSYNSFPYTHLPGNILLS